MARDFNPDTGNVPDGLYEVVNVREELYKPFTYKNWEGVKIRVIFHRLHFVNNSEEQDGIDGKNHLEILYVLKM